MSGQAPGANPRRLARLVRDAVARCQLDLRGRVVLTEAASGAYVVTPMLAAAAGAEQVYAFAKPSRYGSVAEVAAWTEEVAEYLGVQERVNVISEIDRELVAQADIVTNSGHLRPINSELVGWMRPTAVIPLMYESWELRPHDLDVAACRRRGIRLAGTNESHPSVDVFAFLGVLAVKLLLDAGVAVYGSRVLLLCDNPFRSFIECGLTRCGAAVTTAIGVSATLAGMGYDAVLVALQPGQRPVLSAEDAAVIASSMPGAVVAQLWGDIDREACAALGVPLWPWQGPPLGHMGMLLSAIGPEPVVRLQAGGLKVAQILLQPHDQVDETDRSFMQLL